MEFMTHDNVRNVLKAYALTNPRLNYSQGMNFMAGFLFLQMLPENIISLKDQLSADTLSQANLQGESLAYTVMSRVITRYQMENLFNEEVPMLKLMFY